jgi:hypothetical protein
LFSFGRAMASSRVATERRYSLRSSHWPLIGASA